ncbi:MFS transporter [Streptomyces fructofermentans]|uniref:MFS transporter n=1 Tax=Streptomyces fructofermentans TaxID=152141 RepID=A0A918NKS2_9ACTN|nr:MFS transporter [Streptomyces fructofermentans]GGX76277.1 MFS transporter [Streptomyces fructofermentans]
MTTAAPPSAAVDELTRRRLFVYGLGSVGTGLFATVPGLLLLYFMTDALGVPAGVAGLVVALPKAWDAFFNPMVGAASDREAVRTGRRTRLLVAGGLALPAAFAAMFLSPMTGTGAAVWVSVTFVLAASAFALFQVPYVALPTEMSADPSVRTRITVWRIVFLTLGILAAGGAAPLVVDAAGGGRTGYGVMGLTAGLVIAAVMLVPALGTRWVRSRPGPEPLGLVAAFRTARGNRAFFALLASFVLQAAAVAIMLAAAPYVATYRLGSYGLTSVLFVCLVAPSAVAVPLWAKAAGRWGRLRCLKVATCGYALGATALLPAAGADGETVAVAATLALCGLLGVCYAALQVLPLALLPDTVHADAARTGQVQSGAFTGLWTAGETAGLAAGPGAYAIALAATGFASSTLDHPVAQTATARTGILLGFSLVPALLMLLSLPALRAYGRRRAPQETDPNR